MRLFKLILKRMFVFIDPLFALFGLIGFVGVIARRAMAMSNKALPLTRLVFRKCGYLPIRDHYYEPLTFNAIGSKYRDRIAQLLFDGQKKWDFLRSIALPEEFKRQYVGGVIQESGFRFGNGSFESGDAETLYYFVRSLKSKKIVEIGAGNSSQIIHAALKLNIAEGNYGEHIIGSVK